MGGGRCSTAPASTERVVVLRGRGIPLGNVFPEYEGDFDAVEDTLGKHMTRLEFDQIVDRLNRYIENNFPCPTCQCFAIGCCLCTLGLSCIPACLCTNSGVEAVRFMLNDANDNTFFMRGIEWRFVTSLLSSWVEIEVLDGPRAPRSPIAGDHARHTPYRDEDADGGVAGGRGAAMMPPMRMQ